MPWDWGSLISQGDAGSAPASNKNCLLGSFKKDNPLTLCSDVACPYGWLKACAKATCGDGTILLLSG
jgi:hypothetical protein